MKITHLNFSSSSGGAADAARKIHLSLLRAGIQSKLLVGRSQSKDGENIITQINVHFFQEIYQKVLSFLERKSIKKIKNQNIFGKISLAKFGVLDFKKYISESDIIHLHWINNGFLSLNSLNKINKPIVWTLHDMWPITGICHYSMECNRFKEGCGFCPYIKDEKEFDLSRSIFEKKNKIFKNKKMIFVATSSWMYEVALKSPLTNGHKVVEIPLSIDRNIFKVDKEINTEKILKDYGIEICNNPKILLYGAMNATTDTRKGFELLKRALLNINESDKKKYILLVFGDNINLKFVSGVRVVSLGLINNKKEISNLYNCSDLFLMPSIQEAFGLTTLEAINCGCPVVAFRNTGAESIIKHKKNGYLAKNGDSAGFFKGITYFMNNSNRLALPLDSKFNENIISMGYKDLYEELMLNKLT
jgi:glycosyltransferase involved in cell wall biosynthesis